MKIKRVLVVATSRKTRGGITSVIKAHRTGKQWRQYRCKWIETHRDGNPLRKLLYLGRAVLAYLCLLPTCDIVHIHLTAGNSAARKRFFFETAKLFGKKTLVHFHPSGEAVLQSPHYRRQLTSLFTRADRVLVLSEQWKRLIGETIGRLSNIEILYNPCPVVDRRDDLRKPHILFAGSIIERKGYADLIRGFAKIAAAHPEWRIVFAGNGEIAAAKKIAAENGIAARTVFLGWVAGERKDLAFQQASVYCLASSGEGFPMGVLDAWAYGIPCVATPVGGLPDILEEGVNGLIFPVGDIDRLAAQLDRLISDPELRRSIVRQTDALVATKFNVDVINAHLGSIYEQL